MVPPLLRKMMAKRPAERYQTARELATALEPFAVSGPIPWAPFSSAPTAIPDLPAAEEPALPFTTEDGVLINSGEFNGLTCVEAQKKLTDIAAARGFGKATVTFRLKDWGVSRQR